jgi:hypothetical protein
MRVAPGDARRDRHVIALGADDVRALHAVPVGVRRVTAIRRAEPSLSRCREAGFDKAPMVTTWNRSYKTADGAGPRTPISRLKTLYRSTIKPNPRYMSPEGAVFAYRVGKNLMFADDGAPRFRLRTSRPSASSPEPAATARSGRADSEPNCG